MGNDSRINTGRPFAVVCDVPYDIEREYPELGMVLSNPRAQILGYAHDSVSVEQLSGSLSLHALRHSNSDGDGSERREQVISSERASELADYIFGLLARWDDVVVLSRPDRSGFNGCSLAEAVIERVSHVEPSPTVHGAGTKSIYAVINNERWQREKLYVASRIPTWMERLPEAAYYPFLDESVLITDRKYDVQIGTFASTLSQL